MNNQQWLDWLTTGISKANAEHFNREYGQLLDMLYRPYTEQTCDPELIKGLTNQWIRRLARNYHLSKSNWVRSVALETPMFEFVWPLILLPLPMVMRWLPEKPAQP